MLNCAFCGRKSREGRWSASQREGRLSNLDPRPPVNRIAEHVGAEQGAGTGVTPPLVELRHSVRGKCDFHVVRVRKGVFRVAVGQADDAVVNFRYQPDLMDDCGHTAAQKRLRAALTTDSDPAMKVELEQLECAEKAMNLPQLVGVCINSWRMAAGRADFPSVAFVAQAIGLPEPMVKVALREYEQAAD